MNNKLSILLLIAGATALVLLYPNFAPDSSGGMARAQSVGKISHGEVEETSGIVKSETYPDVYWVIGDSGCGNVLWAINSAGDVIAPKEHVGPGKPYYVGPKSNKEKGQDPWPGIEVKFAKNNDWEEITLIDGHLYIFDTGNNDNDRENLGIYVVPEPDPYRAARVNAVHWKALAYSDQTFAADEPHEFDVETHFVSWGENKIYLLTRHRRNQKRSNHGPNSKVYGISLNELKDPATASVQLRLTPEEMLLPYFCPSGGACSPDAQNIAVIGKDGIRIIPNNGLNSLLTEAVSFPLPLPTRVRVNLARGLDVDVDGETKFEAICWDDAHTVRFCNEAGDIYTLNVSSVTNRN